MKAVTLYSQNRDSCYADLPKVHQEILAKCLKDIFGPVELLLPQTKVFAFERYLDVHYVDKNQDLSSVQPISLQEYYIEYTKKLMQPLLDALEKGDFEMAEALTPEKLRLIGYTELTETTVIREEGRGWAGQYSITEVPPGIYPIFTDKFHYHERDKHYTNEVNSTSVYQWFAGTETASSSIYFEGPRPNVAFETPYSYSLAADILNGAGNAYLIYPFQAVYENIEDDGHRFKHCRIIDASVEYRAKENPINLRGRCVPPGPEKLPLSEMIQQAAARRAANKVASPENTRSADFTAERS